MRETDRELDTYGTWQHISSANERALAKTNYDPGKDQRYKEEQTKEDSDKHAAAEFERIQARLRFLNMIEMALQNGSFGKPN